MLGGLRACCVEPCGLSLPPSFVRALSWVEKAAGFSAGDRLSERAEILKAVDCATAEVSQGKAPVRRAPRLPVAVIAALERFVLDVGRPQLFERGRLDSSAEGLGLLEVRRP